MQTRCPGSHSAVLPTPGLDLWNLISINFKSLAVMVEPAVYQCASCIDLLLPLYSTDKSFPGSAPISDTDVSPYLPSACLGNVALHDLRLNWYHSPMVQNIILTSAGIKIRVLSNNNYFIGEGRNVLEPRGLGIKHDHFALVIIF
ncbi:hypothetical protein RRG08_059231 [Elysia crispata]|uniref:Uncharacterized protein n=1 Tax=Elysia crispata TaxID=231223 RepID=A0AAE0ZEV8_9GAST|nr:hypothetical protein RRG08_059231 [Elysia crispata]